MQYLHKYLQTAIYQIRLSVFSSIKTATEQHAASVSQTSMVFSCVPVMPMDCSMANSRFRFHRLLFHSFQNKSFKVTSNALQMAMHSLMVLGALAALNGVAVIRHVYDGTFMESILNLC